MIIRKRKDYSSSKIGRDVLDMICDECGIDFVRSCRKREYNRINFCSQKCRHKSQKNGGALRKKTTKTLTKKYGVSHTWQSSEVKEKTKQTNLRRYGVEHPLQSLEVKSRAKKKCLDAHNVEHHLKLSIIRDKIKQTNLERYGTEHHLSSDKVRDKIKQTNLKRYGTEQSLQSHEVRNKIKQANLEKYGVENPFQSNEIKAKFDYVEMSRKRHQTKKKNGTYGKSKAEDKIYDLLCEYFKKENVKRQVLLNSWNIDFKVKNTFIQFDGVYYHGLNRDLLEIKKFKTSIDRTIYKTYLRDQEQNKWFKERDINLIRIIETDTTEQILKKLAKIK